MFATPIKSLIIFFCSLFVCFVCYFTVGVGFAFAGSADNVSGWAWSENIGWISFNGDNVAGGADYHVQLNTALNQSPTANNLTLGSCDYCIDFVGDVAYQSFSWLYSDPDNDNESQYQFQIANDSGFSSLQVDKTISGLDNPSGSTNSQTIQIVSSPLSGQLTFNRQYWWRVKVWDSDNNDSGWKEGGVFTTSRHPWPLVNFSWMPSDPTMNEDVQLLDQSTVYGGATKSSWAWAVSDATYIGGTNNTTQNPMVRFSSEGDKLITLTVTDSDGFSCTATRSVSVNIALPSWKEISPK